MNATFDPEKNYYASLGLPAGSDAEEIKRAYRNLARRYHPDSGSGDVEAFLLVQVAYEVLGDSALRRTYDRQCNRDVPFVCEVVLSRAQLPALEIEQMLYLLLDIRPQQGLTTAHQPLNLALIIDRSTSMRGARIENVKLAALDLVNSLQPQDRLALISFSDRAEVLMPSTEVRNKVTFRSAISRLVPGGGTEIYQGLLAGLQEVRRHCTDSYISHVILFTDGRTYGDELQALAEARRAGAQNIGLSALGIGEDWNDVFLDDLARGGNGISAYISSPSQVQKILRERIDELSTIVARGLRLKLTWDSSVRLRSISRVAPYLEMLDISDGEPLFLGDLNGEPLIVLLELAVQQSQTGERHIVSLNLEGTEHLGKQPVHLRQSISAQFVRGQPEQEPVPVRLLNALSHMNVFRLQERAWRALDSGNSVQATQLLEFASTQLLNMGHRELSRAALLEAGRVAQGGAPTLGGRKKLRYGTRSLAIVPIKRSRGGWR